MLYKNSVIFVQVIHISHPQRRVAASIHRGNVPRITSLNITQLQGEYRPNAAQGVNDIHLIVHDYNTMHGLSPVGIHIEGKISVQRRFEFLQLADRAIIENAVA